MKDVGKISIILPCYRAEACVGNMIGDVKQQSYTNWELIIVSNGSKQEAQMKVIRQCAEGDERIRLVSVEQGGVSNARNVGMKMMTGEWLVFVDADDRLADNHLDLLTEGMADDVDIVMGGCTICYRDANHPNNIFSLEPNHHFDKYVVSRVEEMLGMMCNKAFKINTLHKWGGNFDPMISYREDCWFLFQLLLYTQKITTIALTGYHYTFDSSSSADLRYHLSYEKTFKDITTVHLQLWQMVGCNDAEISKERIRRTWSDAYATVLNLFKKGSPLSIVQQYRNVKRLVFDDGDVYKALIADGQPNSRLLHRMFNRLVRLHSPLLMTVVYRFLFFCQHILMWLKLR